MEESSSLGHQESTVRGRWERTRDFLKRPIVQGMLWLLMIGLWVILTYAGVDFFVSPASRKARVEAEVVKILEREGPQRPLKAEVELTEVSFGNWEGIARIGNFRYNLKVESTHGRVFVLYSR